jgi:hypothetical protein
MILQMSAPAAPPEQAAKRCEWQYELGYAVAGDDWALVIRTASFDASNEGDGSPQFSDLVPLRDAPLELRLKAIQELPGLFRALEVGGALDVAIPAEIGGVAVEGASAIADEKEDAASETH